MMATGGVKKLPTKTPPFNPAVTPIPLVIAAALPKAPTVVRPAPTCAVVSFVIFFREICFFFFHNLVLHLVFLL